ncbi:hypothetical protein BSZ39_06275 [Bowdeniella nasicola]|uniref:Lipoprotein n=1 Tax=Bowdeniella nasicola TaxID=208480 RepID=A0A1Q5Q2C5_9ACTO|nr:hypothetical protein [Bowdeniella nasicola]OKL54008.1 hypothetical protein BSZ39_06275 [Bowdeniella nasicola]
MGRNLAKLLALALGPLFAVGCQGEDDSIKVPTKKYPGDSIPAVLVHVKVKRVDVHGTWVCPVIDHKGKESLLILPPKSTGAVEPSPTFTVGGHALKEGDTFDTSWLAPQDKPVKCGDTTYEHAVLMSTDDVTQPSEAK